ncbi:MAG TPA: hypothetical protein VJS64_17710 [Pyrinomonadaceae bacterium]|nr:hypothetical protein [Pyrinomonadaceae bacterium]
MPKPSGLFDEAFLIAIKTLVNVHHSIYPFVPPQGIYFESLVEQAFNRALKPYTVIEGSGRNLAGHDLLVEDKKISLKTETGRGTNLDSISITKLCTTEREPWDVQTLIGRVLFHLSRYDIILMLRAIWQLPLVHYQLLEIPIDDLKLIESAEFAGVGKRKGRQSLGANVILNERVLFRVHFDGSDGKCSIRNLKVTNCVMLQEWDTKIQLG